MSAAVNQRTQRTGWRASLGQVDYAALALALSLGAIGGFIFQLLGLPLPWMLGAMTANTVAAVAGLRVRVPQRLRSVMIAVLGIMLGSAFTPDILANVGQWLPSLGGLFLYIWTAGALAMLYLRRVARFDPVTAHFAATPGGFNEMVLVGTAMGGDERSISLVHAARVLFVVFAVPILFRLFGGYDDDARAAMDVSLADISAGELAILAACGVVGTLLARWLRVPAYTLLGPMALSAGLHLAGVVDSRPPSEILAVAQVVVGSAIGGRFVGVPFRELAQAFRIGIGVAAILLGVSAVFALALHWLTGLSPIALFLSFAPGGLAEMNLVALALGMDVAFVSTHHLVRILLVVVLAPLAFRLAARFGNPS